MLRRGHAVEQDKNAPTVFNKVEVRRRKKSGDKRRSGKVMKQNEKFDKQFEIKASNLQSIN
jgi:hypothetical protein